MDTSYIKSPDVIKALNSEQYRITQENGTERPGTGALLHNKEPGIYIDVVSKEPLFTSLTKFDSGSGWPSFTQAISGKYIVEVKDTSLLAPRIEVRSAHGDSHLGHVFNDGPTDRGGLRYCINSASLLFVHQDSMEQEGYGAFLHLLEESPNDD